MFNQIDEMDTEWDMYRFVRETYIENAWDQTENILHRNASLIYIWRKEEDRWTTPELKLETDKR